MRTSIVEMGDGRRRTYLEFFFSSRRRHTRFDCDWSSDVCSSDLAKVVAIQGDHTTARALYEESLTIARVGHKLNIASGLEGLASMVALQGELTWAGRLWGAADALRDAMGAPMAAVERPGYEQRVG